MRKRRNKKKQQQQQNNNNKTTTTTTTTTFSYIQVLRQWHTWPSSSGWSRPNHWCDLPETAVVGTSHRTVGLMSKPIIWVNYNISLTWIKAILGWFPLLTMIIVRWQWGRYNLPRIISASNITWHVSPPMVPFYHRSLVDQNMCR